MINVYWTPWQSTKETFSERVFSYKDPTWLLEELSDSINHENKVDNFFKCPGVLDHLKNTLVLRNTSDIHVRIENNCIAVFNDERNHSSVLFQVKSPSVKNSFTVNYSCNWIFFADKPLTVTTSAPFMHRTVHSQYGYYVPGTFDISKWFRPVEFAFQMWDNVNEFRSVEGEPLIYVKFNTEEKINLKRFNITDEINTYAKGCMAMKKFSKIKALNSLYEVFLGNKADKHLINEIKKNLV